jgi:uncharacterized membrane protein YkvA (DUF1232 family)
MEHGDIAVSKKLLANSINCTALCGRFLLRLGSPEAQPKPSLAMRVREEAQRLQKDAYIIYFVFRHPRTRWTARVVAACTVGYLFSPIQLIPSFIPVIGILDDLLVVILGLRLLQKIVPEDVLTECRSLSDVAKLRRKGKIRSAADVMGCVAIGTAWLIGAFIGTALMTAYLRH